MINQHADLEVAEAAGDRRRRRLAASIAAVPVLAALTGFAVYADQSYRFQDRCGSVGPPPGTPEDQIEMSQDTNLLAGELVCSWDEPRELGPAPYGHSETVLPLFDWTD